MLLVLLTGLLSAAALLARLLSTTLLARLSAALLLLARLLAGLLLALSAATLLGSAVALVLVHDISPRSHVRCCYRKIWKRSSFQAGRRTEGVVGWTVKTYFASVTCVSGWCPEEMGEIGQRLGQRAFVAMLVEQGAHLVLGQAVPRCQLAHAPIVG